MEGSNVDFYYLKNIDTDKINVSNENNDTDKINVSKENDDIYTKNSIYLPTDGITFCTSQKKNNSSSLAACMEGQNSSIACTDDCDCNGQDEINKENKIDNFRNNYFLFNDNILENTRDRIELFDFSDSEKYNGNAIKDIYDQSMDNFKDTCGSPSGASTRGPNCIKRYPVFDATQNNNFYLESGANNKFISNANWIYKNDKVMNGGKFGNIYGYDQNTLLYPII